MLAPAGHVERAAVLRQDRRQLDRWAVDGNVFNENHSHGVRQLVTAPELLAPIDD